MSSAVGRRSSAKFSSPGTTFSSSWRGFVVREGTNWCTPHLQWPQHLTTDASPLATEDRLIYREYHALLLYKLQRREELDRQIERLVELPTLAPDGQAATLLPRDLGGESYS